MSGAAYILAIVSSITYGSADFLGGLGARRIATIWVVAISQASGLLLLAVLLPLLPDSSPTLRDLAWGGVAGIAGGSGVALLYRALAVGLMSVVAPTTAVCAIAIPVVVGVSLGERPGWSAAAGILLAGVAIVLISQSGESYQSLGGGEARDASPRRAGRPHSQRAVLIAILSGVLIGLFLVALERPSSDSGLWPLLVARVASVSFFLPAALRARNSFPRTRGAMLLMSVCGILDMSANVLYMLAVRLGTLAVVATLASMYPATTIVLARLILHERLRLIQWLGVVCAATAILLIVGTYLLPEPA